MDNDKNKKIILVLVILTVIFTIIGGSLAYFSWISSEAQKTNIVFTVERTFSCAADGGGSITNDSAIIVPTLVNSSTSANYIKREVKVTPTINESGKTIYMDLWLDINKLDSGLSNSVNFKYVFTTSSTSNTTGVIASGNFNGLTVGDTVSLLDMQSFNSSVTDTYYLWIWLDAEETSSDTMDQTFNLSLNGSCTDDPEIKPNSPDLDDGMIPVVISDTGVVSTVSKNDTSWYDYSEKKWANVVLVNDSSRASYLNTTGVTVNEDDILAYYVWIPRYKYKIWSVDNESKTGQEQEIEIVFENKNTKAYVPNVQTIGSCVDLENPNEDDYPDCYGAPYSVTADEKQKLITWWHSFISAGMNTSYTLEQATTDVSNCLNNGSCLIQGLEDEGELPLKVLFLIYNDGNPEQTITPTGTLVETNEISYTSAIPEIGDYITHPAFWWDNNSDGVLEQSEILNGIWVGKFETTGTADTPTIKPNVRSLSNQKISAQFTTAQKLGTSTYGSTSKVDAHMMKNSEWGAVAYLSHSKYGVNREAYINNSSYGLTGRSGGNVGGSTAINTVYTDQNSTAQANRYGFYTWDGYLLEYNTNNKTTTHDISKVASTTGNITGVYDMSGYNWKYVMGYYSGASTTWGATSRGNYAGFSSKPASKYFDDYTTTDSLTACNGGICYGHGLSETLYWYNDLGSFPGDTRSWLIRGGSYKSLDHYSFEAYDTGFFNFYASFGSESEYTDSINFSYNFYSVISYVG